MFSVRVPIIIWLPFLGQASPVYYLRTSHRLADQPSGHGTTALSLPGRVCMRANSDPLRA
jgi:hypothetical protein